MRKYPGNVLAELQAIRRFAERSAVIARERYVDEALKGARFGDPLRLERFGFKTYSQYDDDGIIEEIFRRIGTTEKTFVEFGAETGIENNTVKLLLEGWKGLWIEADPKHVAAIRRSFSDVVQSGRLTVQEALITAENVDSVIGQWGSGEIDLLSIDVDGNDYYLWEALSVVRPRVVVIEYDAKFRPPLSIAPEYKADRVWAGTGYMGSSLEALTRLGKRHGYALVGCNFPGVNAFFVRAELAVGKFQAPFSAENHYHPPRHHFLWLLYSVGPPPQWGRYVEIPDIDQAHS